MTRFYDPEMPRRLCLNEDESRHAVRVLRLAAGDDIEVVDGHGTLYRCRISTAHPKRCAVEVVDSVTAAPHWAPRLTLAVAPTKHLDRIEWLVEKSVELGIDRIVPLLCRNSERVNLKTERLERVAVAAMKQSLKATLPRIDNLTPLDRLVETLPAAGQRFVAYCDPALPREQRRRLARCFEPTGGDTVILIGPEGDFAPDEVERLLAAGFVPVTLGESRLRTETAAFTALAMCHTLIQAQHDNND